jgi:3'-phosphoadenosine 5'-phosphosulfate sulfotransferase (PAPS reductase)/FAD synthetase
MTPVERQTFQLHAETDEYCVRIEAAEKIIAEALARANQPYVAFSGGKDSTVMLHMVIEKCPEILVWHWDYGKYYIPRDMEIEIQTNAAAIGARNIRVNTSKKYDRAKRSPKNVLFPTFFGSIQPIMAEQGIDLAFVGLRAQESGKRRLKTSEPVRWNKVMWECYPLQSLTARDVWAYIITNDLPYCSHYDRYGALLGIENTRMSTFFDPEFDKLGASNVDGLLMSQFKHPQSK